MTSNFDEELRTNISHAILLFMNVKTIVFMYKCQISVHLNRKTHKLIEEEFLNEARHQ